MTEENELPTRLTKDDLEDVILFTEYHVFPETTMTVCCLTLNNGYNVIGQSACIDPEAFDAAIGEKFAYEDAFNKLWMLEGYLLKEAHYQDALEKAEALGE